MKYDIESIKRRKEKCQKIKIILWIFIAIVIYNVILLTISYFSNIQISGIFGYKAYAITTKSMVPTIKKGDAVIVKQCNKNELHENDIITFKKNDEYITHRIVRINQNENTSEYVTKGDNNNIEDQETIKYNEILGKKIITIPFLGNLIILAQNSIILILLVLVILIIYLFILNKQEKSENRREKKKIEDENFSK